MKPLSGERVLELTKPSVKPSVLVVSLEWGGRHPSPRLPADFAKLYGRRGRGLPVAIGSASGMDYGGLTRLMRLTRLTRHWKRVWHGLWGTDETDETDEIDETLEARLAWIMGD